MEQVDLKLLPVDDVIKKVGINQAIGIKYVASLLFTYRCTISCKHCLFNCSPKQPNICTNLEDGVKFLKQLRATDRVIHIAGGEPMMYYHQMLKICKIAKEYGCAPHFFETNASWCINDEITRKRYEEMKNTGIVGVYISSDPYHQAFVNPIRRLRAYDIAVDIFGRENVSAADLSLEQLSEYRDIGQNEERLKEFVIEHTPKLIGRAGEELASFCKVRPIESLIYDRLWLSDSVDEGCATEFSSKSMWEIHIDPYGNIQTCCGIILGNAHKKPLLEWMEQDFDIENELIQIVKKEGPFGLLKLAIKHDYKLKEGYPQKCNLCWEVRKYLRPFFPETLGPAEIYTI
ncbi:MAG: radical SAM protein [bacterium]